MDILSQIDHNNIVFSLIGVIFLVNGIGVTVMVKMRANDKQEFEEHKKAVQYKDTCAEVVKRQDERHEEIKDTCAEIKTDIKELMTLVRNNGKPA